MLLLVAIFQLMTSPVAAYMVGRAGLRTRCVDPEVLEVEGDEFPAREAGRETSGREASGR
jgi:multicomponent Na+:H+ antiporter subunit G